MILDLLDEAVRSGARLAHACAAVGLSARAVERWRLPGGREDRRRGPLAAPANKLDAEERRKVLATANSSRYRDLSPKQIVPRLADEGVYLASESSFYRILREEDQVAHRERSRPPSPRPREHVATGPNQVWSWDITYLPCRVRGTHFYLYLILDSCEAHGYVE